MSDFTDATQLLRAILRDNCRTDSAAREHLREAERLGVDPLDYCAHRFGLGSETVWRRAAQWAGYPFAAATPSRLKLPDVPHPDALGEARTLRQEVLGQDVVFYAPGFERVLALAMARQGRPELAQRIRFAPPAAVSAGLERAASTQLLDLARQRTTQAWPGANAATGLGAGARVGFALLLVPPGVLRLLAALPRPTAPATPLLPEAALPIYTVLIPLRDEAAMVPQLARAMAGLDYPPEKLDIRFVVESRSPPTIAAVEAVLGDPRFRLVVVPDGAPRTKPKAADYALPMARGKYLVVFDAEDVPEPDQLRKAASRFEADPDLACLQAELVPENADETVLTALFAGEYAGLFARLLPALARWGLPVPLGGTSNHFRTAVLRDIGGWDAFNVTEDADLGVRLARRGLRVETLDSRTLEEAPLGLGAWLAQRTRWMKGWMQTYIVHNRAPLAFLRQIGWRGFIGFQVLVGGMILSSLLHTVFVGSLLLRLCLEGVVGLVPRDLWDWLSVAILAAGYGGAFAIVVSGLVHQKMTRLLPMQILLPAYWVLHSWAAGRAAIELVRRPIYWAKTTHGVTRLSRGGRIAQAVPELRPRTG